jgi:membrane-associated phospholipid phosphatase
MYLLNLLSILEKLEKFDQWLFIQLNTGTANSFFDAVLPYMRYGLNWAPLYIFLITFALLNFKSRGAWWVLFFIVTVALTDMTGNYVFKHGFERIRPCGDPDFHMHVRLLTSCSSGFSFVSNHAANHFGIATFFFLTMRPVIGRWAYIAFLWAAMIAYAQVYIGIHYPFDVLAGGLLGAGFALLTARFFNKRFGFAIFDKQSTVSS